MPAGSELSPALRQVRSDPLFEETYRSSLLNYEQGRLFRIDQASAGPIAAAVTATGAPRYKILVSREGITRLDYAYLSARAPDLIGLDPAR